MSRFCTSTGRSCEHLVGFEDERRVSWALEGPSYRSCVTLLAPGSSAGSRSGVSLTCSTTSGFGVIVGYRRHAANLARPLSRTALRHVPLLREGTERPCRRRGAAAASQSESGLSVHLIAERSRVLEPAKGTLCIRTERHSPAGARVAQLSLRPWRLCRWPPARAAARSLHRDPALRPCRCRQRRR